MSSRPSSPRSTRGSDRRQFLQHSTAALAGATLPYWFTTPGRARAFESPNERPTLGCIGTGDRWYAVGPNAMQLSNCVAVCDVDSKHLGAAKDKVVDIQQGKGISGAPEMYEDYRKLLDRKDIDVVTIVTTDHWHSKIAIEAMQAGKDVYCEKPLTLTIHEGKQILKVLGETKRVFQVGTQQRSEMGLRFLHAIGLIREGRIGKIKRVICDIGGSPRSDVLPEVDVPAELNWDMWLGQAPMTKYRFKDTGSKYGQSRTHYEFRWWYEYSGGKMTDWGAHHVDIAQWAIGLDRTGPLSIEGTAEFPVPYKDGWPTKDDQYNCPHSFDVTAQFPGGIEFKIVSNSPDGNGILFEGTDGRFHVSRDRMKGKPAEELEANPIKPETLKAIYKGRDPSLGGNAHMRNFFDCIVDRSEPVSDVLTHHRAMTTCHLANIALRLGRKLNWDAEKEQIVGDAAANQWLTREQRKGYEINIPV